MASPAAGQGVRAPLGIDGADLRLVRLPLVTPAFIEGAHRAGVEVHVWTIDDPAEMATLLDLGVDGIMTDQPQVLKDVLTERGQWR